MPYIQSMPPERMARAPVSNEVSKEERQQRMREGIMKKLDQKPEMKAAYETLVKNLPEDQREKMVATLAVRTMRAVHATRAASVTSERGSGVTQSRKVEIQTAADVTSAETSAHGR